MDGREQKSSEFLNLARKRPEDTSAVQNLAVTRSVIKCSYAAERLLLMHT